MKRISSRNNIPPTLRKSGLAHTLRGIFQSSSYGCLANIAMHVTFLLGWVLLFKKLWISGRESNNLEETRIFRNPHFSNTASVYFVEIYIINPRLDGIKMFVFVEESDEKEWKEENDMVLLDYERIH